jgi:hypothetical protein
VYGPKASAATPASEIPPNGTLPIAHKATWWYTRRTTNIRGYTHHPLPGSRSTASKNRLNPLGAYGAGMVADAVAAGVLDVIAGWVDTTPLPTSTRQVDIDRECSGTPSSRSGPRRRVGGYRRILGA